MVAIIIWENQVVRKTARVPLPAAAPFLFPAYQKRPAVAREALAAHSERSAALALRALSTMSAPEADAWGRDAIAGTGPKTRSAGFSNLTAYWTDIGVSSALCAAKLGNGEDCVRDGQCGSNYCGQPSGEELTMGGVCGPQPGPTGEGSGGVTKPSTETVFPTYNINSPIGEVTGPGLIGRIIKTILGVVGALALAMFIYGGFTWLTSAGSPDKIKKGKDILIWAVIGLVVIFASYTAVDFVLTALGI